MLSAQIERLSNNVLTHIKLPAFILHTLSGINLVINYLKTSSKKHFKLLVVTLTISIAFISSAQAITMQAKGQAIIVSGDTASARATAISRAKKQAALQASAFISAQPNLNQATITQGKLASGSLEGIARVTVLKEDISGNLLSVTINVKIENHNQCENGQRENNYRKRIAIAAFPMQNPAQANIGRLRNIESRMASELANRLSRHRNIEALNAGKLMLQEDTFSAASAQLPQGTLTSVLQQTRQLEVQFVISGVVRDISLLTPSVFSQKNYFIDQYNKLDYLSSKYMRAFEIDLFIHDGLTGSLIEQKQFRTAGSWGNNDRQKFGFASAPFWKLDYGKQVRTELDNMADEIVASLRCNSYAVEISRTHESKVWFKSGSASGVKAGDLFDVYRKSTYYDAQQVANVELTQTNLVLTVRKVRSNSAEGVVNGFAEQSNIQSGDVLISQ